MTYETANSRLLITLTALEGATSSHMTTFIESVRRILPDLEITLHMPSVIGDSSDDNNKGFFSFVRNELSNGTMTLWSAGFAGAAVDLLHDDEAVFEREWGASNPWREGWSDRFGITNVRYAPLRTTVLHAEELALLNTPVCLGMGPLPSGEEWTARSYALIDGPIGERERRDTSAAVVQVREDGSIPSFPGTASAPHFFHLVMPRMGITGDNGAHMAQHVTSFFTAAPDTKTRRFAGEREYLPQPAHFASIHTDSIHPASHLYIGAGPYGIGREPAVLAGLTHTRTTASRVIVGITAFRTILLAAADRIANHPERTHKQESLGLPVDDWESQGTVFGTLTIDEAPLKATFINGRVADLRNAASDTDERAVRRAQGYHRTHTDGTASTTYLETSTAVWFTGKEIRCIRETAVLDEILTVETTGIVRNDVPALVLNQHFTLRPEKTEQTEFTAPHDAASVNINGMISAYELPLCTVRRGDHIFVTCGGKTTKIQGENEHDLTLSGRVLTVHTAQDSVCVQPGYHDMGGHNDFIVPFHLAVIPSRDKVSLVLRTTSLLRNEEHIRRSGLEEWTTSYVFTVNGPLPSPPAEAAGFTAH